MQRDGRTDGGYKVLNFRPRTRVQLLRTVFPDVVLEHIQHAYPVIMMQGGVYVGGRTLMKGGPIILFFWLNGVSCAWCFQPSS